MNVKEYGDFKDIIIYSDSLMGDVSLNYALNSIKDYLDEQKEFEDVVYHILKNMDYDNETIASLFNLSTTSHIKFIVDLIQDNL